MPSAASWNGRPRPATLAHGGGSFPYTIGRIEHGFYVPDPVATDNPRNPREYLKRFDALDSCVHDDDALRYLLNVTGVGQVMLGTDYPFPLGEQEPGSGIEALGLDEAGRERLFHGTALEWLGLPKHRFAPDTPAPETHSSPQDRSRDAARRRHAGGCRARCRSQHGRRQHHLRHARQLAAHHADRGDTEAQVFQVPDPSPTGKTTLARVTVTVTQVPDISSFHQFMAQATAKALALPGYQQDKVAPVPNSNLYTAQENGTEFSYTERDRFKHGYAIQLRCMRPSRSQAGGTGRHR
ncbi:amidohydrolase family protein [Rhodanobacter lindaniclasticus]